MNRQDRIAWDSFEKHLAYVRTATQYDVQESEEDREKRKTKARKNYRFYVAHYFPHYASVSCGWFHVMAANIILKFPILRMVLAWFRFAGKSVHACIFIPMWLKIQQPRQFNTLVLINKSYDGAKQLLGDLQAELQGNERYINDFGIQVKLGSWEEGEFTTKDGCAFFALGLKQSPRGLREGAHRPDLFIFDDIDDDQTVLNEPLVDKAIQWILRSAIPAMDVGRGRVLFANNIIHERSIIAKIIQMYEEIIKKQKQKGLDLNDPANTKYYISKVPIRDTKGNLAWPEKMTNEEVDALELELGYAVAQTELYHNPITEGKVWKREWIQYKKLLKPSQYGDLVAYYDGGYKNTGTSDSKSLILQGLHNGERHVLKVYSAKATRMEAVMWHYDLHAWLEHQGAVCRWFMEEVFMLDILYEDFEDAAEDMGFMIPLIGDKRQKPDKDLRIGSMAGGYERGNVYYNAAERESHHMKHFEEQHLVFQPGKKTLKDGLDAEEGGTFLLQKQVREDVPPVVGMRSRRMNRYRH